MTCRSSPPLGISRFAVSMVMMMIRGDFSSLVADVVDEDPPFSLFLFCLFMLFCDL